MGSVLVWSAAGFSSGWEWRFSEPQVISFARRLLADGVPAWKRLKVIENLCWYRDHVLKTDEPSLDFSRRKLKEAVELEKYNAASDETHDVPMTMEDIEEIAGVIDPHEPEALQAIRRKIRLDTKRSQPKKLTFSGSSDSWRRSI